MVAYYYTSIFRKSLEITFILAKSARTNGEAWGCVWYVWGMKPVIERKH